MKRIRYFLCIGLLLIAWSANAQLFVGNDGTFFIKTGTPIAVDSLYMVPSTDVTLSDLTIRKADTSMVGPGGESLRRVYFFSYPVSFTGSVGFQYRNDQLNGNHENGLQFSHYGAGVNLSNSAPFLYDTVSNFIRQDFTDTIDLSVVTAVDPGIVLPVNGVWFDSVRSESMRLRFKKGIGTGRLVVMKKLTQVSKGPHDNTHYTANTTFGLGSDILGGNYVVYNGNSDSVTVFGLEPGVAYHAAVFEYITSPPNKIDYRSGRKASDTTLNDFIVLSTAGKSYRQSFNDSLIDGAFPVGWSTSQPYQEDNGSSALSGVKSYGGTGGPDRALGSVGGSGAVFGAKLVNKTKKVLTSVLLNYSLEQWRSGGTSSATTPDSLIMEYSLNANSISDAAATWQGVASIGASSAVTGTTAGPLDGDFHLNRKTVEGSITGISIGLNAALWIRFRDMDLSGADDGLAVDDITIVPFSNTLLSGGAISSPSYNDLNIVSGNVTVNTPAIKFSNALNISKNALLDLNTASGKAVLIYGDLFGTGTISMPVGNTGIVTVGGNSLQQRLYFTPGLNTIASLNIRPLANAGLGNELNIAAGLSGGKVQIGSFDGNATFSSDGFLTLKSDTARSATIKEVFGTIKGAVNIERAFQNRAGIRLVSNPFKDTISVHQLKDDISLVVSGGSAQNCWYYDQFTTNPANISILAATSSWTEVVDDSALWIFGPLRLQKPAGALTLDFSGEVNQGDIQMPVNGGTGNYVVLGNPYPATIDLGGVLSDGIASGAILPAAIYSWNPAIGTQGGFVTIPNSKFNITHLPICGSFVALVTPGHSGYLDFHESDKTTVGNTLPYFRPGDGEVIDDGLTSAQPEGLELIVEREGAYLDGTYVYFNEQASAGSNKLEDAPKIDNPELNLYSRAADGARLSVDSRPFRQGSLVPISISRAPKGEYRLKVADMNLPADKQVYLLDNYMAAETPLEVNSTYAFAVTEDNKSYGDERFHLRMGQGSPTKSSLSIDLMPNPAVDQVTVSTNSVEEGQMEWSVISSTGQELLAGSVHAAQQGRVIVSVAELAPGIYVLEVNLNGHTACKKFIKR